MQKSIVPLDHNSRAIVQYMVSWIVIMATFCLTKIKHWKITQETLHVAAGNFYRQHWGKNPTFIYDVKFLLKIVISIFVSQ